MTLHTPIRAPAHDHTDAHTAHMAERAWFHRAVRLAILATLVVLVWSLIDHDHEELIELADQAILVFFAADLGLRLKADPKQCVRSKMFWVDVAIMILALLPLGAGMLALRVLRGARLVHVAKHLPHLRHFTLFMWLARRAKNLSTASRVR